MIRIVNVGKVSEMEHPSGIRYMFCSACGNQWNRDDKARHEQWCQLVDETTADSGTNKET